MTTIKKGAFCIARRKHSSTFIGGKREFYESFEILKAEKVNIRGLVFEARTVTNSRLEQGEWDYMFSINDHQEQASRLWNSGTTKFDDKDSVKAALTR